MRAADIGARLQTGPANAGPTPHPRDVPAIGPENFNPFQGDTAMIKLNCGVSRKVGEPNYGSRGASVNVEMELESTAIGNLQAMHDHVKKLFLLAKSAVDEELGIKESIPARLPTNVNNGNTSCAAANGTTAGAPIPSPIASNTPRLASQAQVRAIRVLCEKLHLDAEKEIRARFNCGPSELTLVNASTMIDDLKGRPTSNSK